MHWVLWVVLGLTTACGEEAPSGDRALRAAPTEATRGELPSGVEPEQAVEGQVVREQDERDPERGASDTDNGPDLSSPEAVRAALGAAQRSPAAIWELVSPERGLSFDLAALSTHNVATACDAREVGLFLREVRADLVDTALPAFRVRSDAPFACASDLSMCSDCPEDLRQCEDGTIFELATSPTGRRTLTRIIRISENSWWEAFEPEETPTLEALRERGASATSQSETGIVCQVRELLRTGRFEGLLQEDVPDEGTPIARHLPSSEATGLARQLAGRTGYRTFCNEGVCAVSGAPAYGVYVVRRGGRLFIPLVTVGPASCDGCAPEASPETHQRAMRAWPTGCTTRVRDPSGTPPNIRRGPRVGAPVVGTVENGSEVTVARHQNGWAELRAPTEGWLWAQHLVCD